MTFLTHESINLRICPKPPRIKRPYLNSSPCKALAPRRIGRKEMGKVGPGKLDKNPHIRITLKRTRSIQIEMLHRAAKSFT